MCFYNINPHNFTYSLILTGLINNKSNDNLINLCIKKIEKDLMKNKFEQDFVFYNSLFELAYKHNILIAF